MLTADRIKPYLLHEDKHMRAAAANYFYDGWSRDPDLVPLVLTGCERFGFAANVSALSCSWRFPLREPAFERVLGLLTETDDPDALAHLGEIVAHAPVELLLANETRLFETPRLNAEYRTGIRNRLSVASWSTDRLWDELQTLSRLADADLDAEGNPAGIDHTHANALVEALGRHETPADATVCRLLADKAIEGQWLEISLIDLAGERRLREAIPLLVNRFHVDSDYVLEQSSEALARMGDPAAVPLIRAAFPDASWDFRFFGSSLLGDIKQPESEDAIIALLETERDVEIRTNLCLSLCNLFSERAIEIVCDQIQAGYAEQMVKLEEELLIVAELLGIELPEAERWRRERDERGRHLAARLAESDDFGPRWTAGARGHSPPLDVEGDAAFDALVSVPFRRQDPRVGRNDPCPCGSGKKFKRCCGGA